MLSRFRNLNERAGPKEAETILPNADAAEQILLLRTRGNVNVKLILCCACCLCENASHTFLLEIVAPRKGLHRTYHLRADGGHVEYKHLLETVPA